MKAWWSQTLWLPVLVGTMLAGWFVVTQPGDVRKDALEYDQLAVSLLEGRGYSYEGVPSMLREPGYPVFRAVIYATGGSPSTILWLQVLLVGLGVFVIGLTFERLSQGQGVYAAWGAALAYGYAVYAASHYSEAFTGFLVALTGWLASRCQQEKPVFTRYALFVIASAALVLTRMNMAFIPPVLFFAVAMTNGPTKKQKGQVLALLTICWLALLMPWAIRNGRLFQEWTISGRSGIQLYARMVKAREPMTRLGASLVSVVGSRVASTALGGSPILIEEQWQATWKRYQELLATPGISRADADRQMRREALQVFSASPLILAKYFAWTSVEGLRLWALPSVQSRSFPIENSLYGRWMQGDFTLRHGILLALVHLVQLLLWITLAGGLYHGAKRYGWRWIPGLIVAAVTLAHLPFDVIVRYGVPAQPWLWAVGAWFLGDRYAAWLTSHRKIV